jgi:thiol-disulfide isomerase/thioredoxin
MMRLSMDAVLTLVLVLAPCVAEGAQEAPAENLAALKQERAAAGVELANGRKPGTSDAEKKEAVQRYYKRVAALGRRAVALARSRPGTSDAIDALIWAQHATNGSDSDLAGVIYDALVEHYLDSDAILPVCRVAWLDAFQGNQTEAFLRAAVERSKNLKVRALGSLSLARHQYRLARVARDLKDPMRGAILTRNFEQYGPVVIQRLRALDPDRLEREAEAIFERTKAEFGDLQPMGKDFPPLGEQATGMLFQMHHLGIGRTSPEIDGEDIDGKPMKLSDFRGKVVVISFWATWCGPCMELVPEEKALVEKMKGRPFALIGVNGDENRGEVKSVSAKEGIKWRSFWTGGPTRGIPVQWGVSGWPTVYVIDCDGVVRDNGLVYFQQGLRSDTPDKFVEELVAEAEKAAKNQN